MNTAPFLSKQRITAHTGFNRWLVPPVALHLCIGMAYSFSVFWLPLSKAIGIESSVACVPDIGFFQQLFVKNCDWKVSTLGWMYSTDQQNIKATSMIWVILAWVAVAIPMLWGMYRTILSVKAFF